MRIKLDAGAFPPIRAHAEDAGLDLRTPIDVLIPAGKSAVIDTGVHVELPPGTVGMLKSKSGLNVKHNILSEGVIDCGYAGSIVAKLYNNSDVKDYHFRAGDKITQLVVLPLADIGKDEIVDEISGGERGAAGFGSSGR